MYNVNLIIRNDSVIGKSKVRLEQPSLVSYVELYGNVSLL